ncbi:ribbon-helix-helix protein, CopG family [Stenotrophomonas sp. PS02289]|uniref:ribbon-helix-helix protein, CopG family n=1 Tax=Stenotrophomonas sp. PS02289 TaxID=2991422 RepID=UPI00249B803F|nr:ribbon-helix-helix protein, CopG family [Stenotrophomonas sp. PS02289]
MLTIRLDSDTTDLLDDYARRSKTTKSEIAREAIRVYLRAQLDRPDLDDEEVDSKLLAKAKESRFERFQLAWDERAEHYRDATEVADWVDRGVLFSRSGAATGDRVLTGINEVIGFTAELDDAKQVYVIVRHRAAIKPVGADRFHYYVFPFKEWKHNMRPHSFS